MSARSHPAVHTNQAFRHHLDLAIDRLVTAFHPEQIILFGSWVDGVARPESSIDLLLIARTKARFIDRIKQAIEATAGVMPNIAPLVYTPEEVSLLQDQGDGFIQDILDEGKVLYHQPMAGS